MAFANPDLEIIDRNDEKQSVTVRNKQTGEEVTVNLEDIEQGRIEWISNGERVTFEADQDSGGLTMTSDQGTVTYGSNSKVPDWVPAYPGSDFVPTHHSLANGVVTGQVSFQTGDATTDVVAHYEKVLVEKGWERTQKSELGEVIYIYFAKGESETIMINVGSDGTDTRGAITYSAPE